MNFHLGTYVFYQSCENKEMILGTRCEKLNLRALSLDTQGQYYHRDWSSSLKEPDSNVSIVESSRISLRSPYIFFEIFAPEKFYFCFAKVII